MKTYTEAELKEILKAHSKWLVRGGFSASDQNGRANLGGANLYGADLYGANLYGADLYGADLGGANLRGANLEGANLRGANLYGADLYGANLYGADLRGANLGGANLYGANLYGADLYGANLYGANLYGANLGGADLGGADLRGANLEGANLGGAKEDSKTVWPFFQISQEGSLIGWKAVRREDKWYILKLEVIGKRTASLIGRKCRTDAVKVLAAYRAGSNAKVWTKKFTSWYLNGGMAFHYSVGSVSREPKYNPDPKIECTEGIHFFLTREEAEDFAKTV